MRFEPTLVVVTDVERFGEARTLECFERISSLAMPGSVCLQLREPRLEARDKLRFGQKLGEVARRRGQWLAVNDRLDLAVLLKAEAVHLGEGSVETLEARGYLSEYGLSLPISRACHDPEALATIDADAVILSPVVEARKGNAALGEDGLRRALLQRGQRTGDERDCKLFALGGVTADTAEQALQWGAQGVAVQAAGYAELDVQRALLQRLAIAQ